MSGYYKSESHALPSPFAGQLTNGIVHHKYGQ